MARQEKPLDPAGGPVQQFAVELRKLRQEAGGITYRAMAARAGFSAATLAQAASGVRLPSLPVTLAYVAACGGGGKEWEQRWRQAAAEDLAGPRDDDGGARPPYMGLRRFQPQDRELFFGRDQLTADLTALVLARRFVAVAGASGSGKSSLLRAGLIPDLQTADARARPVAIRILTPGPHPARTHAHLFAAAEAGDGDTVIVVDQFEEAFTLCHDPAEREEFIELLLAARRPEYRLRVVIAMRADFFGHCAEHRMLADALHDATLLIAPMGPAELREAIVKPAAAVGLIVERALTARVIEDVTGQPGGLPLMSHVLLETWRRRRTRTLTLAAYEAAGGIRGAIAQSAEDLYTELTPAQARHARRMLLRLVTPGDGAPDTRRPADRAELEAAGRPEAAQVLEALAAARLLTLDDTTVEIAHEALLTAWPRLHGWIEEDRDRLRAHRRLAEAARIWQELGREAGALYRGSRLATAEEHFTSPGHADDLIGLEHAFLTASLSRREQEERAAARTYRRLRTLIVGLAVLLLAAITAGLVAAQQRAEAVRAQGTALSRQLAAQALALVDSEPTTGMLLGVEAFRAAPTVEARGALLSTSAHHAYQGELTGHTGAVSEAAFSPDGRTLVTVSSDHTMILWDVRHRTRLATITGHDTWLRAVAFSPDGRLLATGGDDRTVMVWDVASGTRVAALTGHTGAVIDAAFSPDGGTLATAGADRTVLLWDTDQWSRRGHLDAHSEKVNTVAFSPDGRLLATGGDDHTVVLWDAAGRTRLATLTGHSGAVLDAAFSLDSRTLATAGQDGSVALWDTESRGRQGRPSSRPIVQDRPVRAVAFSPDGRTLVSAGHDRSVTLWDTEHHTVRARLTGHSGNIYAVAINPRSGMIASAEENRTILLWDPTRSAITLSEPPDTFDDVAFSPDGATFATADGNHTMLWDTGQRTPLAALTGHTDGVDAVAFSPDGDTLATAGRDRSVMVWDVVRHRRLASLTGHRDRVLDVAFSPDSRKLASVSADQTVMLWDVASRTLLAKLTGHMSAVEGVAFSPDGNTVATASHDQIIVLWDAARGTRLATLTGHTGWINTVAFSPDGRLLASGAADQTVMLWDVADRTRVATLTGYNSATNGVAFAPDGRILAFSGGDHTLQLWDVTRRTLQARLTGHTQPVMAVAFSPDGRALASVGLDQKVILWHTDPERTMSGTCEALARNLAPDQWREFMPEIDYHKTCGGG
jgi:WD40 repeat protein